jgi:8-oxo-dGTP pyrophosphatase MutT (NUDIX family)|tara:strand:- start:6 stop:644 length:639 start_codon:yes stop_codon:yes gene_type:complete
MEITINKIAEQIKERLKKPLPGNEAHLTTRIKTKSEVTFPNTQETARPAAVLILLFPFEDEIQFFLTKRTEDVEHHKGQISLPGGIRENNESLNETALRETKEEVGIDSTKIIISGSLTPFFIPVTGYIVHPFIGWCKEKPSTKIHDVEVNQLFSVSITELMDEKILQTEQWNIRGYDAIVPYYNFGKCKVWGATAAILSEFKSILEDISSI